jgi:DNA-binding NarL/FixJ family response regulator
MSTFLETTTASVLIVDDHPAVREALVHRLSRHADLALYGEAASAAEALEAFSRGTPDVAVVDLSLKDGDGIDLIKRIRALTSHTKILVCSMYDASLYADRAFRAGARGYITKEHATDQIIEAIRQVQAGNTYRGKASEPASTSGPAAMSAGTAGDFAAGIDTPIAVLSDREMEVFRLIGEGVDMTQIGERLGLSVKTIETYRARIKQKLNITNRMELIHAAVEWVLKQR